MPKFSILTVLLSVALVAVAIWGFVGHQRAQTLTETKARLELAETKQRTYYLALQLLSNFDLEDSDEAEKHRVILWMTEQMQPVPDPTTAKLQVLRLWDIHTQLASINTKSSEFELLVMNFDTSIRPNSVITVLALFHNDILIDHVFRQASTRVEDEHEIRIVDEDDDGKLDVIIEVGFMWKEGTKTLTYEISENGLELKPVNNAEPEEQ